jgi:hypothetical protein
MPRMRWLLVLVGAVTFIAAHAIEVAAHIGGPDPWFISAASSALVTAAAMFVAGIGAGLGTAGLLLDAFVAGVLLTAGAVISLVITLFAHSGGPGNLFPIAILIGTTIVAVSSVAGALGGWLVRRSIPRTPR